ncbi:MAG: hypothetical protein V1859_09805 [archaeon]
MIKKAFIFLITFLIITSCVSKKAAFETNIKTELINLLNQNAYPPQYGIHYHSERSYRQLISEDYWFSVDENNITFFNSAINNSGNGINYYCYQLKDDIIDECECQLVNSRETDEQGNIISTKTIEECGETRVDYRVILTMPKLIKKLKNTILFWENVTKFENCFRGSQIQDQDRYEYEACFENQLITNYTESYNAIIRFGDGITRWEIVPLPIEKIRKEEIE